jgi:hypothetical protein
MRRSPERIYEARRAALLNRLRSDGLSDSAAEEWVGAWETAASSTERDRPAFWIEAERWIVERRARRVPP